jgi:hypothetical protein
MSHERHTFAGEVIHHRQDTEAAAAYRRVAEEIERPPLVRTLWQGHRQAHSQRPLATDAAPGGQQLRRMRPIRARPPAEGTWSG